MDAAHLAHALDRLGNTGRVLYIAGHGMFMNGMILQEDNDNFCNTKTQNQKPRNTKHFTI